MGIGYGDFRKKKISDKSILRLMIFGTISVWVFPEISLVSRIVGIFTVSVLLLLVVYIMPGSIGGGDIKLMAISGWIIGSDGIWNAFVIGIFTAGFYVILLLLLKIINRKTEIALGTFLCIGIIWMILKI